MMIERRQDRFRVPQGPQLGSRLTRAVVLSVAVALLVSGLIFDVFLYVSQRSALLDDVTAQARIAAENSSAAILFNDGAAARQTLEVLQASPAIERADLYDAKGQAVASYVARGATDASPVPKERLMHDGAVIIDGRLHVTARVREGTREVGHVHVRANLRRLHERLATYVGMTLVAGLLAFSLAFVLVVPIRRKLDATERRLDYLAYYDTVTSLQNRHAANEQIDRLIETVGQTSEGFALLLLDLDNFKFVNDTLGHSVGDDLLRALATRLTKYMRSTDVAFRYGGDEFLILAPRVTDPVHMQLLGQAAMLAFDEPLKVGVHELRVRGSVGVAQFPQDAGDAAGLIRAADSAMYEAKSMGKNTYALFSPDMHRGADKRMRIENDLRVAITRHELRLLYQPIVDLATERLIGVEALLRWSHPQLGVISPVEFVPVAESSGLIVDIGEWVLKTACEQLAAWEAAGHTGFFVAVNVSARQIRRGLNAQVQAGLAASGVDPGRLEIEITEHSMVEDIESNVTQLEALRQLGVQVAVDDFGTGLSSLAYLKRLPIGKLKIDRAFIKDLPSSADDAAITQAIISMAHSLSLTVVAEGVETEAQRDYLKALGCECGQGYLFSRPVPPEAIAEMLSLQASAPADAQVAEDVT